MSKNIYARSFMFIAAFAVVTAMTSAAHAKCIMAGGQGYGPVAEFMAKAAMKNSIKAWAGSKKVKIGKTKVTCTDFGMNCTAKAKACK